jgi:hypothetical protein
LLPSIACSGFAGGIGRGDALDVENILDERSAGENKTVDVLVYGLVGFLSLLLLFSFSNEGLFVASKRNKSSTDDAPA